MDPKISKIIKPESPFWPVTFTAREGVSIKEAIIEAARVCRQNDLEECDLNIEGFLFNIEPGITPDEINSKIERSVYAPVGVLIRITNF